MRVALFYAKLLLITLAALAVYAISLPAFNSSHLSSGSPEDEARWETNFIRAKIPVRLVQPEWVSRQPDLLSNWVSAESKTRFGAIGVLWLASLSLIIRQRCRQKRL